MWLKEQPLYTPKEKSCQENNTSYIAGYRMICRGRFNLYVSHANVTTEKTTDARKTRIHQLRRKQLSNVVIDNCYSLRAGRKSRTAASKGNYGADIPQSFLPDARSRNLQRH